MTRVTRDLVLALRDLLNAPNVRAVLAPLESMGSLRNYAERAIAQAESEEADQPKNAERNRQLAKTLTAMQLHLDNEVRLDRITRYQEQRFRAFLKQIAEAVVWPSCPCGGALQYENTIPSGERWWCPQCQKWNQ